MSIAHNPAGTTVVFIGVSESSGDTITNTSTDVGIEKDVLGDDTSTGVLKLYAVFTSTVTAGTLDFSIVTDRISGQSYVDNPERVISIVPANATKKCYLCTIVASRYMLVTVKNNATGASATNVFVGGDLYKIS